MVTNLILFELQGKVFTKRSDQVITYLDPLCALLGVQVRLPYQTPVCEHVNIKPSSSC